MIKDLFEAYYLKFIVKSVIVCGVIVVFLKFIGPIPFILNETVTQKDRTFDVSAEGKVTAVPDTAQINIGVNITQPTVAEAQKEATSKINAIIAELKEIGIEDKYIKTQSYSVFPDYNYNLQTIVGYKVNTSLAVKVKDFEKINDVINKATALGANQIGSLSFVIDDDRYEGLKTQARRQAIENAKDKAKSIAKEAGINLGRLINVTEPDRSYNYPYPSGGGFVQKAAPMGAQSESSVNVQPGENEIKVTVTLSYETY